jgi:hypothetical protein
MGNETSVDSVRTGNKTFGDPTVAIRTVLSEIIGFRSFRIFDFLESAVVQTAERFETIRKLRRKFPEKHRFEFSEIIAEIQQFINPFFEFKKFAYIIHGNSLRLLIDHKGIRANNAGEKSGYGPDHGGHSHDTNQTVCYSRNTAPVPGRLQTASFRRFPILS